MSALKLDKFRHQILEYRGEILEFSNFREANFTSTNRMSYEN